LRTIFFILPSSAFPPFLSLSPLLSFFLVPPPFHLLSLSLPLSLFFYTSSPPSNPHLSLSPAFLFLLSPSSSSPPPSLVCSLLLSLSGEDRERLPKSERNEAQPEESRGKREEIRRERERERGRGRRGREREQGGGRSGNRGAVGEDSPPWP